MNGRILALWARVPRAGRYRVHKLQELKQNLPLLVPLLRKVRNRQVQRQAEALLLLLPPTRTSIAITGRPTGRQYSLRCEAQVQLFVKGPK